MPEQMPEYILPLISAITNVFLLFGLYLGYGQLKAARKSTKAQVLMKLSDEWRNKEIYESAIYIHNLRNEWRKLAPIENWPDLANKWVEDHYCDTISSDKEKERFKRRTASQFLAKMGSLIKSGYLTSDEFFGVVPETGRLLVVLMPIEMEIIKYWTQKEQIQKEPIAEWDHPFGKWEFNDLWKQYKAWHLKNGLKFDLNSQDWSDLS